MDWKCQSQASPELGMHVLTCMCIKQGAFNIPRMSSRGLPYTCSKVTSCSAHARPTLSGAHTLACMCVNGHLSRLRFSFECSSSAAPPCLTSSTMAKGEADLRHMEALVAVESSARKLQLGVA
eukprot:scaffold201235_cov18-Tisochrysis_lutea.AAC.1